eukprot:CAMPEP_0170507714 /NCGR_PEP_ID=MMETSP0208-20121228/59839_1 /TAXON_ID=197538 /ORGANISM="Strombidium inclinatum, Strain S3" /LENGTH=163 /DNA_ID=CAMNT_0010790097 /DNA_START=1342 /DNA_END=1830 /DNA_ORIENTATION=-
MTAADIEDEHRPSIQEILLNDKEEKLAESVKNSPHGSRSNQSNYEAPVIADEDEKKNHLQVEKTTQRTETGESSSARPLEFDLRTIKTCINKISNLNQKQVDRAFKQTARNRKMNSIGSFHNMTIGQAYFNLNKDNYSTRADSKKWAEGSKTMAFSQMGSHKK